MYPTNSKNNETNYKQTSDCTGVPLTCTAVLSCIVYQCLRGKSTVACVVIHSIYTCATIQTRVGLTLIQLCMVRKYRLEGTRLKLMH